MSMRIVASQSAGLGLERRQDAPVAAQNAAEPVRTALPAIIPNHAPESRALASRHRPLSALLAQLIAAAEDLPAARVRRRADPGAGMDAYQAAARLGPAKPMGRSRFV
jgi:hypothetical protein